MPDSPTELTKPSWSYVARKTVREFSDDQCTDLAAALTYYAVLSLFQAAIAMLSLVGLVGRGPETVDTLLQILRDVGASNAADTLEPRLTDLSRTQRAGLGLVLGLAVGLGSAAVTAWNIAKWPVLLVVVVLIVALLYYATPNVRQPTFRWISVGAFVAIVVWVVASALFGLYVANFSSYDRTYGSLAGVVAFLLWLWITNLALLFGAELNAELERAWELQSGQPAEEAIQLPARDTRKSDKADAKDREDLRRGRRLRLSRGKDS